MIFVEEGKTLKPPTARSLMTLLNRQQEIADGAHFFDAKERGVHCLAATCADLITLVGEEPLCQQAAQEIAKIAAFTASQQHLSSRDFELYVEACHPKTLSIKSLFGPVIYVAGVDQALRRLHGEDAWHADCVGYFRRHTLTPGLLVICSMSTLDSDVADAWYCQKTPIIKIVEKDNTVVGKVVRCRCGRCVHEQVHISSWH